MAKVFAVNLKKPDKIYEENKVVEGEVEIQLENELRHDGVFLSIEGIVKFQFQPRGTRLFNSNIKPIVILNDVLQLEGNGKLNAGRTIWPFEFELVSTNGQTIYESYHGYNINISYVLKCEIKRSFLLKDLICLQEIIVQNKIVKRLQPKALKFEFSRDSIKYLHSTFPLFQIVGYLDSTVSNIEKPLVGEIIVGKCDAPIKSIEVQLNRVETYCNFEDSVPEETAVQNIQIANGDVLRNIAIPIYMVYPRLLSCPTLDTRDFKIDFNVKLLVILEDGSVISESFPLVLHRSA